MLNNEAKLHAEVMAKTKQENDEAAATERALAVHVAQDDLNSMLHPAIGSPRIYLDPRTGYYNGDPIWASRANADNAIINGR